MQQSERNPDVDRSRRRFLTTAATIVGGVGVAAGAVPFVSSWTPSEKTRAIGAPVEVDVSQLSPGELLIVEWQGKPVWILRRDETMLADLESLRGQLRDPDSKDRQQPEYAQNATRASNPEYLVVIGICTHLGCSPLYATRQDEAHSLGDDWKGGFFCPCHGSRFDLAGRVFKGVPAPLNLVVPPYQFLGPERILIGDDGGVS